MGTNYARSPYSGGGGGGGGKGGGGSSIYTLGKGLSPAQSTGKGSNTKIPYAPHHYASVPTDTTPFQADTSGSKRLNAIFNNPGALGLAGWESIYGATASGKYDTGHAFAKFPSKEAGAAAQFGLWMRNPQFRGQTLGSAITNWIGPGEHGEAEYIAKKLGIPLSTVISPEFLRSPMGVRLMQAQAQYEGANVISPEQWKRAQDWAYKGIKPTNLPLPSTSTTSSPQQTQREGVTINYTVHHHGDSSDHHAIAALHRKHMLDLKDNVEDVVYERNRRSYVPRYV
jgi:hypothetical protein